MFDFKSVARPRVEERVPSASGPQPYAAAGPVCSEGRPSARRGPGFEIQGPQCAFETSMFMCPAVHMSTRNLLRSSSTHEPSDPPFRVVSSVRPPSGFIGLVRSSSRREARGVLPLGRSRQTAPCRTQGIASSFKVPLDSGGAAAGRPSQWSSKPQRYPAAAVAASSGELPPSHRSTKLAPTPVTPRGLFWW